MKSIKKTIAVLMAVITVLSVSVTAFAAGADKRIKVDGSTDGYITVSNVTSEKAVGYDKVYYASSPATVTFSGSDLARQYIDKLTDVKVSDTKVETGENSEVTFHTTNGVTLKDAGVYHVVASTEAAAGTSFYIVISADDSTTATTVTATPTASAVLVDGSTVSFDAYTINGNIYFKLRDMAKVLNGTGKQFEVSWDDTNQIINLKSNFAYTAVGGEMTAGDGTTKSAALNTSAIYKDGIAVTLTAYTINGNNYFKLRDIGQAFNFGVTWDGTTNTIKIDTSTGYTAG